MPGAINVSTFRAREGGGGSGSGEPSIGSERLLLLYRQVTAAEESLRSVLPHTLTNPSAERAARAALDNAAQLSEWLLRQRAISEQHERNLAGGTAQGLWSIKTASQWLELSDDKVRKMVDEGALPHVLVGGVLRIPADKVLALVDAGTLYGR
jgi:excisionase family DNA binding protein